MKARRDKNKKENNYTAGWAVRRPNFWNLKEEAIGEKILVARRRHAARLTEGGILKVLLANVGSEEDIKGVQTRLYIGKAGHYAKAGWGNKAITPIGTHSRIIVFIF